MNAFRCLARAFVLTALAGASENALGAEQSTLTLPEVSVIAPGVASPPKPSPYFGNPRVQEEKWPEIPCGASRIGVAGAGTCKTGTRQETMAPVGVDAIQQSNCGIGHDLVMFETGVLRIEADALVFDPTYVSAIGHQHRSCFVESPYRNLSEDFRDLNQITRRGSGWRNFIDNGDLSTMEFTAGADLCLAIQKRGPRWGGGYVWLIHASICRTDRRAVDGADVELALAALQVRTHDSRGNLRAPTP